MGGPADRTAAGWGEALSVFKDIAAGKADGFRIYDQTQVLVTGGLGYVFQMSINFFLR